MNERTDHLTHVDEAGNVRMVNVGAKAVTARRAVATGRIMMRPRTLALLVKGALPKGEALAAARLAGILAAKRVDELIPLCHSLPLDGAEIDFEPIEENEGASVIARATCHTIARTGVEMEALTAVSVALLTIYDMAKAVDREMRIDGIRLVEKTGGKSDYRAADAGR